MTLKRIKAALPLVVLILVSAMCFSAICSLCLVRPALAVAVDGKLLGTVSGVREVEETEQKVNAYLENAAYGNAVCRSDIEYYFVYGSDCNDKAEEGELFIALYTKALENYKNAYGLYVDGKFIAANTDADAINNVICSIREQAQGELDCEVVLNSSIEVINLYYPEAFLKADNELFDILAAGTLYTAVPGDVDISFSQDEEDAFAPGSILDITVGKDEISSYRVTVTEAIPYTTRYEGSSKLYIGDYEKKSDGVDGSVEYVYEVTLKDGEEVARELVSTTVLVPMQEKVVYEGTKPKPSTASKGNFIWPMDEGTYYISSYFGGRELFGKYNYHSGLDLAGDRGENIYAADGGVVTTVGRNSSYGIYVVVTHDNGYVTLYAHMSKATATEGERVFQGEKLGEVGSTGLATGDHLHFEVRYNGVRYDPMDFLPQ